MSYNVYYALKSFSQVNQKGVWRLSLDERSSMTRNDWFLLPCWHSSETREKHMLEWCCWLKMIGDIEVHHQVTIWWERQEWEASSIGYIHFLHILVQIRRKISAGRSKRKVKSKPEISSE